MGRRRMWFGAALLGLLLVTSGPLWADGPTPPITIPVSAIPQGPSWHWTVERVDTPHRFTRMGPRHLALDAAGRPHISYEDLGNWQLKYAYLDGTSWITMTVNSHGAGGLYTSLRLDAAGHPHIGYSSSSTISYEGPLEYAHHDGTTWHVVTVDAQPGSGAYSSLDLDAAGRPAISYCMARGWAASCGELRYAHLDGSAWLTETVDVAGGVGRVSQLALDSASHPHIAYNRTWPYGQAGLKYAHFDGSTWQVEQITTGWLLGWQDFSLALDSTDLPHISSIDSTCSCLRYAHFDEAQWFSTTVDFVGENGRNPPLALDPADHPHIVYQYDFTGFLRHAWDDGTGWQTETLPLADLGWTPSLAIDSAGQMHLIYYSWSNNDLLYARHDGSTWSSEVVEHIESGGSYIALTLDALGRPHIAYTNGYGADLVYAYRDSTSWHMETVTQPAVTAGRAALALDAAGTAFILYRETASSTLRLAHQEGAVWQTEALADGTELAYYGGLALDAAGNPHASYWDSSEDDLLYAAGIPWSHHWYLPMVRK